jgi:hypothetical protein
MIKKGLVKILGKENRLSLLYKALWVLRFNALTNIKSERNIFIMRGSGMLLQAEKYSGVD